MTLKESIVTGALRIFKAKGIEANSEDAIIEELGIDSAAYYELFRGKADLVRQATIYNIEQQKANLRQILSQANNPVEEIMLILQNGITQMQQLNPLFLSDTQQFYPASWALTQDYLGNYSQHLNAEVINRGILQGTFRRDINLQLVTKILLEQFYMMINPMIFPPERYSLPEVFRSIYLYYVRGICTDLGGKMAEEYFSKNNI